MPKVPLGDTILKNKGLYFKFNFLKFLPYMSRKEPAMVAEWSKALSNAHTSSILRSQVQIPLGVSISIAQ